MRRKTACPGQVIPAVSSQRWNEFVNRRIRASCTLATVIEEQKISTAWQAAVDPTDIVLREKLAVEGKTTKVGFGVAPAVQQVATPT